jgi:hypothetical protein
VARKPALDAENLVAAESAFDSLLHVVENFVRGGISTPQPNRPSVAATDSGKLLKGLERETGIEPATSSLGSSRSTAELLPLRLHSL